MQQYLNARHVIKLLFLQELFRAPIEAMQFDECLRDKYKERKLILHLFEDRSVPHRPDHVDS